MVHGFFVLRYIQVIWPTHNLGRTKMKKEMHLNIETFETNKINNCAYYKLKTKKYCFQPYLSLSLKYDLLQILRHKHQLITFLLNCTVWTMEEFKILWSLSNTYLMYPDIYKRHTYACLFYGLRCILILLCKFLFTHFWYLLSIFSVCCSTPKNVFNAL